MDVRATVIAAVNAAGVECRATPPAERPSAFCTVVQGSGRVRSRVACPTLVSVTAWEATEARAWALCARVRDALCEPGAVPGALAVVVNANVHPDNDPESGTPRATVTIEVNHRI